MTDRELTGWLVNLLAEILHTDPHSLRRDVPLREYGVDSLLAATLLADLDDELGLWVDPGDVPPGITLDELAAVVHRSAGGQALIEAERDVA